MGTSSRVGTRQDPSPPLEQEHRMTHRGDAAGRHVPVLRDRIVELLSPALAGEGAVCVDATLGMGGHAEVLLEACPSARLIGLDRDEEALALAGDRLARFEDRFLGVHAVYDEIAEVVATEAGGAVHGILFDLGVSSLQLDEADRGFAYRHDAPLDMRMDQTGGITAADVLNTYDAPELTRILRSYGEERFASRIAAAVVRERAREPFTTSARLVDLLRETIPAASQRSGGHPAKRTFQALRIEVNDELAVWQRAVTAAVGVLAPGGRIAVLSYHSLEDRITKQALAAGATSRTPHGMPVERPEDAAYLRLLTRGAEVPGEDEQAANPRSASARLRAAERVPTTTGAPR
jgi:16S rRNA (cytosine1402-N4)-methyltransferase